VGLWQENQQRTQQKSPNRQQKKNLSLNATRNGTKGMCEVVCCVCACVCFWLHEVIAEIGAIRRTQDTAPHHTTTKLSAKKRSTLFATLLLCYVLFVK
jgi:hypothetical protein